MPIRALPSSAGYMFAGWPASPPVFEDVGCAGRLWLPIALDPLVDASPRITCDLAARGQPVVATTQAAPAVLAPCAGRCVGIATVTPLAGPAVPAVEFEPAESPEPSEFGWTPFDDLAALDALNRAAPEQLVDWLERIRAAGVGAQRVTCPDLSGQLHQLIRRPIDTIICGVLDSDPAACLNAALAGWYGLELAAGLLLLARITRAQPLCAIDARVPPTWSASLRRAAARGAVRVEPVVNDYPQADPTLMLYSLLGRRLRPGRLPAEQGVLYLDAAAAIAIGRCALGAGDMTAVPLAIRDHALRQTFFLFAPLGMRLGDVLGQTGVSPSCTLLRAGDAARDVRGSAEQVIGAGELLVHASPPEPLMPVLPCVRCGWCVEACPTRLQPAGVLEAAQRNDLALAEWYGLHACIECGICSYVCPSRLPLLEGVRQMRRK